MYSVSHIRRNIACCMTKWDHRWGYWQWEFHLVNDVPLKCESELQKLVYSSDLDVGVPPPHSVQVLDMCAAPGSKTAQLIEMIHANDGDFPSASSLPGI